MIVSAIEGHRAWARSYDTTPNPVLGLEARMLQERFYPSEGMRILDAGSGTGRRMQWAAEHGACVFGVDACFEMILEAERKPGLAGRSAVADLCALPMPGAAFDVAICSFALSYIDDAGAVLRELARTARMVIVSDLHPDAARSGWKRGFRAEGRSEDRIELQRIELQHHARSIDELDRAAADAGLIRQWRIEACFGEPERALFCAAGRESAFEATRHTPAVLITAWRKYSG